MNLVQGESSQSRCTEQTRTRSGRLDRHVLRETEPTSFGEFTSRGVEESIAPTERDTSADDDQFEARECRDRRNGTTEASCRFLDHHR